MHYRKYRNPWPRRIGVVVLLLGVIGGVAVYYSVYPERLPEWAARTELGQEMQTTRVYKWQDTKGAWHITDRPPPDGVAYEVQAYSRDDNVLPLPPRL